MSEPSKLKKSAMEKVAELGFRLARPYMAEYGATRSRHDFTQRQLMGCLILKVYMNTTYRGLIDLLAGSTELRRCLALEEKLPHYTTLQKFSARTQVQAIAQKILSQIGRAVAAQAEGPVDVAMDSTGLTGSTASDYYQKRTGRRIRRWIKVSVLVACGSLLPLALVADVRSTNDCTHADLLLTQAQPVLQPRRLYADAGYDAEWIHQRCRQEWGVESVIPAIRRRADGQVGGHWRAQMNPAYLKQAEFGQRWEAESFMSAFKRKFGSTLRARRPDQMIAEAVLKVLAYALWR